MSVFDDLPLNTQRCYVMGEARGNCQVYIPVASREADLLDRKRKQLQDYLDLQVDEQPLPPSVA